MKIKEVKQLCCNQIKVVLEGTLLVNIKSEGEVNIDTLIFKKINDSYSLYEIFIPDNESNKFKDFSYGLREFNFIDTNTKTINNIINSKIEIHKIIPLNYLKVNGKYCKVNSIGDILDLKNILTKTDTETLFRKIPYSFSKQFEGDDGFIATEFEKVVNTVKEICDSNLSLNDFFNRISVEQNNK